MLDAENEIVRLRAALDAATAQIRADEEGRVAWCRTHGPGRDLAWYQMAYPKACDALDNERAEVRRLRAALDAATRERDEALAMVDVLRGELAAVDTAEGRDNMRDAVWAEATSAVVAWLRASANARHPIEIGEYALSPAGRGLGLLWADAIERGDHMKENP